MCKFCKFKNIITDFVNWNLETIKIKQKIYILLKNLWIFKPKKNVIGIAY